MDSKGVSCVHAIVAAGILMLSAYAATTAFGEDAPFCRIAVLRRDHPGNETLQQIETAMDAAWDELIRPSAPAFA